ncbi:MAG: alanine/ornithine racemase family PLP-dependent enzyme [Firmicutes bacterium]|nr:alanine/ornithine racemase family PLP-dependent enzyme [Bacillota bacterium]
MHLPKLWVDTHAIYQNSMAVVEACRRVGLAVFGVTKGVGALPAVARAMLAGGVAGIGDSRVVNLLRLRKSGIGAPLMLLRSPTMGEISSTVTTADIVLCSAFPTMQALARAAIRHGRETQVIPMVEMGDRREGLMPEQLEELAIATDKLPGIRIRGLGTNLACFAGALPTPTGIISLESLAQGLGAGPTAQLMLSAGNSSALGIIYKGQWPKLALAAHLRVGESILLGWDVITKEALPGTSPDAFRLDAEVIEVAKKPSLPDGATGCNAFDEHCQLIDRGTHWRAVVALGRQELGSGTIRPTEPGIEVIGMTSDHTILAIDNAQRRIDTGTQLQFRLDYGGLLAAMTSPYVGKIIRE